MTNKELIEKLQASVEEYGVLPVYMELRDYKADEDSVIDVISYDEGVVLYNFLNYDKRRIDKRIIGNSKKPW